MKLSILQLKKFITVVKNLFKSQRAVLFLLIISLSVGLTSVPSVINAKSESDDIRVDISPGKLIGFGWKAIKYGSNTWLTHQDSDTSQGDDYLTVNSGTVGFNNKGESGYGASFKHEVKNTIVGEAIETHPRIDPLNMFTQKLSIVITDSNNNDVVSQTLTHNQYVFYNIATNGTHTVRYVEEDKINWTNFEITLWNDQFNLNVQDNRLDKRYWKNEEYKYLYPSREHSKNFRLEGSLTFIELQDQFYDVSLNEQVYDLKNFSIGDRIDFSDRLQTIIYDRENDHTLLGFHAKNNEIMEWVFKGDLTRKYGIGDVINLTLNVVEEINGFETIDLIKNYVDAGEVAEEIDNYL